MLPDLPVAAVERILQLARGRHISGTNRYACVCRLWRDAGCSSEQAEQLLLYLDVGNLSAADLANACSWMSLHGIHVDLLIIDAINNPQQLGGFVNLRNLKWLEVLQEGSLAALAPMLDQLPHLRHLAAGIWMAPEQPFVNPQVPSIVAAVFCDQPWTRWRDPPDMGRLCGQLTHLHLTLDTEECDHVLRVDPRLPVLLPPNLQQLTLFMAGSQWQYIPTVLQPSSLAHLSALQKLELGTGLLQGEASQAVAIMHVLPALQQLDVDIDDYEPEDLVQLAPVLVSHTLKGMYDDEELGDLTPLTHLTCLCAISFHRLGEGEGAVRLLEGMGGLNELQLSTNWEQDVMGLLYQAAGISSLRTLAISHVAKDLGAVMERLAQCTQLTCLHTLGLKQDPEWQHMLAGVPVTPVPTHLTGLRCLVMGLEAFQNQATPWLAALTRLTFLCVVHEQEEEEEEPDGGIKEGRVGLLTQPQRLEAKAREAAVLVQAWPASLQRLVFWLPGPARHDEDVEGPTHWVLTPSPVQGVWVSVWRGMQEPWAKGWARPGQPCPHLPGVWELLEVPSSS